MSASTLRSQPLLALWPVQNGPELGSGIAEAFSHPPQHIREDFGTARFDDNLSGKDLLFAVYTVDDSSANTPSQNPLSLVNESLREQVASVQEQHVFSPSLLNTARFGYSRASYFFTGYSPGRLPGWVTGEPIGAIVISGSTASNGASAITQAGLNVGSNNTAARNLFTLGRSRLLVARPQSDRSRRLASAHPVQRSARAGSIRPGFVQHAAVISARHSEDLHRRSLAYRARLALARRLPAFVRRHDQGRRRASNCAPASAPSPPTAGTKRRAAHRTTLSSTAFCRRSRSSALPRSQPTAPFPARAARGLCLGRVGQRQDRCPRRLRPVSRPARYARLSP